MPDPVDRTIPTLRTDNPITPTAGVLIPASASGVAGAIDAGDLLAAAPAAHASTHVKDGADELSGCSLACSYAPANYTPTAGGTIANQFAGIDTRLANAGNGVVTQDANGDANVTRDLTAARNITATSGYIKSTDAGLVGTPSVRVAADDRGVYSPGANQIAVAANSKAAVLDGGAASAFTPLTSALLRLGSATLPWLALHASRLVSAVFADPTDETKLFAVNVANVTTGTTRTLTMPDANVTLVPDPVNAAAVITDHALVRGDGGVRGVQDTGITVDDSDNLTMPGSTAIRVPTLRGRQDASLAIVTDTLVSGAAPEISIVAGSSGSGNGGNVDIEAGQAGTGGTGGSVDIQAGTIGGGQAGGDINLTAVNGDINIKAAETGGAVNIQTTATLDSGAINSGSSSATPWRHTGSFACVSVRALGTLTFTINGDDAGKIGNWTGTTTGVAGTIAAGVAGQVTTIVLSGTAGTITFAGSGVTVECEEGKTLTTLAPGASTVVTISIIYISSTFAIVTGGLA